MKLDKETQEKIQELQIAEQNSQAILLQKQTFQLELNETISAAEEVKKTKDEIFKIVGQVMIKAQKAEIEKELEEKKRILEFRIKAIENQEALFRKKLSSLQQEIEEKIKKSQ